jgi:beta-1,4-mannosyl-glycoprotein beta-1,4-N-acetylglucosaminyltransferase
MKIYDSFLFFNELDLLEIRLNMVYPIVDHIIISECDTTFSGLKKPFYFEENKKNFEPFLDKIIHLKHTNVDDYNVVEVNYPGKDEPMFHEILTHYKRNIPEFGGLPNWHRDFLHRELVKMGMKDCDDEDIIIFSDLDEIPNPVKVMEILNTMDLEKNYCLLGDCHNFYVNNICHTNWYGPVITKFKNLRGKSIGEFRLQRYNFELIEDSSWHLSFVGGPDRIKTKIVSWGHQEFNNPEIINGVTNKLDTNRDLFNRTNNTYKDSKQIFFFEKMKTININGYYPEDIVILIEDKFPYLIKK